MKRNRLTDILCFLLIFLAFSALLYYASKDKEKLIVVLSPHFDDGVFSLGGLMSQNKGQLLVATFFTARPTIDAHTHWDNISGFLSSDQAIFMRAGENNSALLQYSAIIKNFDYPDFQYRNGNQDKEIKDQIILDIESIIKTYKDRDIYIYGPSTFGPIITHPDHQIVHDAIIALAKQNINPKVHFFIYEDFPYIIRFSSTNSGSIGSYLSKVYSTEFQKVPIELTEGQLSDKIFGMYHYVSQVKAFRYFGMRLGDLAKLFYKSRCKLLLPKAYACEVVYKI